MCEDTATQINELQKSKQIFFVCNQFTHLRKDEKKNGKKTNNEGDDTHFQQLLFLSIIAHITRKYIIILYQLPVYTNTIHTHTHTSEYSLYSNK